MSTKTLGDFNERKFKSKAMNIKSTMNFLMNFAESKTFLFVLELDQSQEKRLILMQ